MINRLLLLKTSVLLMLISMIQSVKAQEMLLDSCQKKAYQNHYLIKQFKLLELSRDFSIENVNKLYLPQLSVIGQASYQSDVTKVPIQLPNINITPLSKDQYRMYLELNQPITDLLFIGQQRELVTTNNEIELQKTEVELYKLKEKINHLFFGILLFDEQIDQINLLKKDISTGIDKLNVAIANGIAIKSQLDLLKVESIKADQRLIEIRNNRTAFINMLSLFIHEPIGDSAIFIKPVRCAIHQNINRPELQLFELQKKSILIQSQLINNKTYPKLSFFVQTGIGRPALNGLSNDLNGYYIGGLRLQWNIASYYTIQKEKKLLLLNQKGIDVQKDIFLFTTKINLEQQNVEMIKYRELIQSDQEILILREDIKNTSKLQLENGSISVNDFILSINQFDQANQTYLLHQTQFLMSEYNFNNISGN